MNQDNLSQVRAWASGRGPLSGVKDPYEVQNQQMAAGWAREAANFHSDTIEHRARIGNLERGVKELVDVIDERDATINRLAGLMVQAYAPLRNLHLRQKPAHRDVAEWTRNDRFCVTCSILFKLQEAVEKETNGRELGSYAENRKAGGR